MRTPLYEKHVELGAKLVDFAGWEMPVQYEGIREEHMAVRTHAGMFDVSHMGEVEVEGPGALDFLQLVLSNDVAGIDLGGAQYSCLCAEDGGVLDDLFAYRLGGDRYLLVTNSANHEADLAWLGRWSRDHDVAVRDVADRYAMLAVQGPHARAVLSRALNLELPPRMQVAHARIGGRPALVCGTGYTGEDGVELHVPVPAARAVWRALLAADVQPAGLGARDTLRLEAGLPLHGHELGPGITPLQAGLGWVVRFDKGDFRGRAPLEAERDRGVTRRLRGLATEGRQFPREGYAVTRDGAIVGEVTSGNFSPTLGHGIALAFLPPDTADGDAVTVDVRGREVPAIVTKLPFVRR